MEEKIVINEKLFYRFIEFTSKHVGIDLPHETFKLICLDCYTAQTHSEHRVKRFADAFRYLIHNVSSDVTQDLIKTTYFILTNRRLSKKINSFILEKYYQRLDDHPHQKATTLFLAVSNLRLTQKAEFAFLLANYVLIRRGFFPIIVYPNDKKVFLDALKLGRTNTNPLYLFIIQSEHFIRKTHQHQRLGPQEQKSKDEVVSLLKMHQETLQNQYHVKQLYLYGSYVKETNLATSDIDVLVVFEDDLINYEKNEVLKKLRTYLHDAINDRIDAMEFSHALTALEIHEMTHIISII